MQRMSGDELEPRPRTGTHLKHSEPRHRTTSCLDVDSVQVDGTEVPGIGRSKTKVCQVVGRVEGLPVGSSRAHSAAEVESQPVWSVLSLDGGRRRVLAVDSARRADPDEGAGDGPRSEVSIELGCDGVPDCGVHLSSCSWERDYDREPGGITRRSERSTWGFLNGMGRERQAGGRRHYGRSEELWWWRGLGLIDVGHIELRGIVRVGMESWGSSWLRQSLSVRPVSQATVEMLQAGSTW
ncbi:hypothetical protein DFP72DRAFT_1052152 [Ephemerocybe angulata]|uniref:Uncharacterized protein n=1 Tax=Ephemerocybe angulata TaxID=980116 RepID=A0A8H6LUJ2_9AGAR|nr:hypothetical protein DFP72DRAFT_1052152 [Tulosesus angulatus]